MAWRCRFLAAQPSQNGRVIAEEWFPHSSRLERPTLRSLSGPGFSLLKFDPDVGEIGAMHYDEGRVAAGRREAARIDIPGLRGFWRQRQVRERGIQLGLGLLFVDFRPV